MIVPKSNKRQRKRFLKWVNMSELFFFFGKDRKYFHVAANKRTTWVDLLKFALSLKIYHLAYSKRKSVSSQKKT